MRRKNMRRGGSRNRYKGVGMKYNVIYDISTEEFAPTIMAIHTPTGNAPYRLMKPLFDAYKRYRYVGCDITIVNGSRILNPSSAYTTQEGMQTADPRDNLDPIMFKGCHGEDLGLILNQIYGNVGNVFTKAELDKESLSQYLTNYYYQSLADTTWKKGNINSTLRIPGLHPLCYSVATNTPLMPSFRATDNPIVDTWTGSANNTVTGKQGQFTGSHGLYGAINGADGYVFNPNNIDVEGQEVGIGTNITTWPRQFFTTRLRRLPWIDTKSPFMETAGQQNGLNTSYNNEINMIPKLFMGILMLPSAKKSYNYLRVIVSHKWRFSGLRTISEGMVNGVPVLGDLQDAANSLTYNNYMSNVDNPTEDPSVASMAIHTLEMDDDASE